MSKPMRAATPSATLRRKPTAPARPAKSAAFKWKGPEAFADLFTMSPMDRIEVLKQGVAARTVVRLAKSTGQPKDRVMSLLGLPRSTVDRKARSNQLLPMDQGERVLGLIKLVGQVQVMVDESGDPDGFDAARWVSAWLERPLPALGNRAPGELMDTSEGQQVVASLLAGIRSGVFA